MNFEVIENAELSLEQMDAAITEGSRSKLAEHVASCYRIAYDYRHSCDTGSNGSFDCQAEKAVHAIQSKLMDSQKDDGEHPVYLGAFARLKTTQQVWFFDRIEAAAADFNIFTMAHTPVADVSDDTKKKAIDKVMSQVYQMSQQSPLPPEEKQGEIAKFALKSINELKANAIQEVNKIAESAVNKHAALIKDQLIDGGMKKTLFMWMDDYLTYPNSYIWMRPHYSHKPRWSKNKLSYDKKIGFKFERVSPLDVYASGDGSDVNDSSFIVVRTRVTFEQLRDMRDHLDGADKKAINLLLNKGIPKDGGQAWLDVHKADDLEVEYKSYSSESNVPMTWVCLVLMQKITGAMCKEVGITKYNGETVKDDETYECEVWAIDNKIVYATPNVHPLGHRTIYKTSYSPINGSFYGRSAFDLVEWEERSLVYIGKRFMKGVQFASWLAEVNKARMSEDQAFDSVIPESIITTIEDSISGGQAALKIHNLPGGQVAATMQSAIQAIEDKMQKKLGTFDMMAGAMTGMSSAIRTGEQMSTIQANSSKQIVYRQGLADIYLFNELIRDMYHYNMAYSEDNSIKADAEVIVGGLTSVATRQQIDSKAIGLMNMIMPIAQAQNILPVVTPEFVAETFRNAAGVMGGQINELASADILSEINSATPQPRMPAPQEVGR